MYGGLNIGGLSSQPLKTQAARRVGPNVVINTAPNGVARIIGATDNASFGVGTLSLRSQFVGAVLLEDASGNVQIVAGSNQSLDLKNGSVTIRQDQSSSAARFYPASDVTGALGTTANRWTRLFVGPTGLTIGNGTNGATLVASGTSPNESLTLTMPGTGVFGVTGPMTISTTLGVTGIITPTGGIKGTITNDNATAGNVGEFTSSLIASGSAVSLTTATPANVTSISLTAGDWDVAGNINYSLGAATATSKIGGISSTSATLPTDGSEVYNGVQSTLLSATDGLSIPRKRFSLAGTTTVYLVAQATFSAGTVSAFGALTARRIR